MRSVEWIVLGVLGAGAGGCFDEGGDATLTQSAQAVGDGLVAFADIQANLTADPAAAGDALLAFMKTPIAANNLISPPFDLGDFDGAARIAAPAGIPGCLTTSGMTGCDRIDTKIDPVMTCDAGPLSFTGWASRNCTPTCADLDKRCTYDWDLDVTLTLPTTPPSVLTSHTTGPITVDTSTIGVMARFRFSFMAGARTTRGFLQVKSCGTGKVNPGPPKRLTNAVLVVNNLDAQGNLTPRCATVRFDAAGVPTPAVRTDGGCRCP